MRKPIILALAAALFLGLGSVLSCSCGDDDDNDDAGAGDDDGDDDTDDDDADDDLDDDAGDDDATGDVFDVDFEDYNPGPLDAPWTVEALGASTAIVVDLSDKSGTGRALEIDGGTTDGDGLLATYDFDDFSGEFWFQGDFRLQSPGAEFGLDITQNNTGAENPDLELSVTDGVLWAGRTATYVACGAFSESTWHTVVVHVDWIFSRYDVYLDGALTDCVNVIEEVGFGMPHSMLLLYDWSDPDKGGLVQYDNLKGFSADPM